jgi:hypothetical protein
MSLYRNLKRERRSDVHHVAEHSVSPEIRDLQVRRTPREQNWTGLRKAMPADTLLPTTVRWMSTLPFEFQPTAIAATFPRIANALAALWPRPDALGAYLIELFVDTRGGRKGFPIRVLRELHMLRAHYASLHPGHREPPR